MYSGKLIDKLSSSTGSGEATLFPHATNNIVAKTKDNFTNEYSHKFLFEKKVVIDRKNIEINEVKSLQKI